MRFQASAWAETQQPVQDPFCALGSQQVLTNVLLYLCSGVQVAAISFLISEFSFCLGQVTLT